MSSELPRGFVQGPSYAEIVQQSSGSGLPKEVADTAQVAVQAVLMKIAEKTTVFDRQRHLFRTCSVVYLAFVYTHL